MPLPQRKQQVTFRNQRRYRRVGECFVLLVAIWLGETSAAAESEPSVEDVKAAGEQFNLGRTAFKEAEYVVAAEHFERADGLAPNAKVLELAIQARLEAQQLERAAMLAAVAQRRYPDDERFADAGALVEKAEQRFARLDVSCDEPCSLVIGMRLVHGAASREWILFLKPGEHSIRAGWGEETVTKEYTATKGEPGELAFEKPAQDNGVVASPIDGSTESSEFEETLDPFGLERNDSELPAAEDKPPSEKSGSLSPTWFWVGAGTTVALAGVSSWSGIDTLENPGQSAVREQCEGLGEECELYQEGVRNQNRTNILWGITAGVGVATVVLYFLTDWGPDEADGEYTDATSSKLRFSPWLGLPVLGEQTAGEPLGTLGAAASGRF